MPVAKKKARSKPIPRKRARRALPERVSTAITKAPTAPPFAVRAVPAIKETVENMERVRRFVSKCLNVDLQREMAKLAARADLTIPQKADEEKALRERYEIDWGTIPGVDKPFLKQPGAEKVLFWLGLRPIFHKTRVELDRAGHMEMLCYVTLKVKATGEEAFEGPECSCTTMEDNYRFRWAERDPQPDRQRDQVELEKLKAVKMGRWSRKNTWVKGRRVETWVWLDRVENPNVWNERNKVSQIGQKRALVKCVRNAGALSEIFVSDPAEWQFTDPDEGGSPYIDAQYTESGRKIEPEPENKSHMENFLDRLTPEQRAVEEAALKKAEHMASAATVDRLLGKLVYSPISGEKDLFKIEGPLTIIDQHKDVLRPFWHSRYGASVVDGERLEGLKYHFEHNAKVPFGPKP